MGKKGDTENLKRSFRIASKNMTKFVVIYYKKMYHHAYFYIFLSSRVLKTKNFLNYRIFPMLFKWEIEALWGGGGSNRSNWTLSPCGIFFIIFFETFYMVSLINKSIWKIRHALMYMYNYIAQKWGGKANQQANSGIRFFTFTKICTYKYIHKSNKICCI